MNTKGLERSDPSRATSDPRSPILDLVIVNGRVIDPETKLDAIRNVGFHDGRIAAVSDAPFKGQRVVDAKGLVVAPGFIDWHSHGQNNLADRTHSTA